MNKTILLSLLLSTLASTAMSMEVLLATGLVNSPFLDGSYSNIGVGSAASVFMCLTDATTYSLYQNDSRGLYEAWQNGDFASEQRSYSGQTTNSRQEVSFEGVAVQDIYYALAIATYDSQEFGKSYYIARAIFRNYTGNDPTFDVVYFSNSIAGASSWTPVPEPTTCSLLALGLAALALRRKTA